MPDDPREPQELDEMESPDLPLQISAAPQPPKADDTRDMTTGVLLIAGCHLLAILVFIAIGWKGIYSLVTGPSGKSANLGNWMIAVFWGGVLFIELLAVIQFVYVLPAIIITGIQRKYGILKGIIVATALTILLAGGSFALCTIALKYK